MNRVAWIVRAAWCLAVWLAARPTNAEPVPSPLDPRESLQHIVLEPGLVAELAACEPDVIDPVAIRFDEDGRMWVVQMRDYPTADTPGIHARSRISRLEDADGDGFFEMATVFADDLPYATGVQPWQGGVFVTLAGQVAYLKDTTGDGKADHRETWFTGFAEDNTQLRANHPTLGLDNHVYVANGLRGGTIVDARAGPQGGSDRQPVSISGMDFRFDPRTGRCEAVSGVGQFGLTFDDHGNRFVCSNRNPAIHVVIEDRSLRKNPLLAISSVSTDVADAGPDSRVFPIARAWTTSHLHAGQFTAACGVHVYRGDALPGDHSGSLMVCEPTGHLVHREVVHPLGVTFRSKPATGPDRDAPVEFFASRDEWCAPVSLEVGPDGALYVVDMYRAVIEHPHWMPDELRRRPDLAYGSDRGRIYRIVPVATVRVPAPRLSAASSRELVGLLGHSNVWHRETAARLLLERDDRSVAAELTHAARSSPDGRGRTRSLRVAEGLGLVDEDLLLSLLEDSDPRVVEQAILVAEPRCLDSSALQAAVARLARHPDARVRFAALLAATPLPTAPVFATDRWERQAMLIATGQRGGDLLQAVLENLATWATHVPELPQFIAQTARLAAASPQPEQHCLALAALAAVAAPEPAPEAASAAEAASADASNLRFVGLAGFLAGTAARGDTLHELRATLDVPAQHALDGMLVEAVAVALDVTRSQSQRGAAIDVMAFDDSVTDALAALALGDPATAVRCRAIAGLVGSGRPVGPWRELLRRFADESPAVRAAILGGLWADPARVSLLLDEVAAGHIRPTELDASRADQLLRHPDPAIRQRAATLFAEAVPADRAQALADYQEVLTLTGDPARGRTVFEKNCGSCHRVADVGTPFAPDISDAREKSIGQLLTDIIQPNRAIDANYFRYTATTVAGLVHTGVLVGETSTSVTLRQPAGEEITLRRDDIEELKSDGVSFMPEGMEKAIPPQAMADLIGFIKHWRYLDQNAPITDSGP
jgi:putative membrane-bound dehydrogenase-like protein